MAGAWFFRRRRLLFDSAIRIAVVVAGLLSVPGLRHVGAHEYDRIIIECNIILGVNLPII